MVRQSNYRILGVGSALLDILARVDDAFLAGVGEKGGTVVLDAADQATLIGRLPNPPVIETGGSAGNTVYALARLGLDTAMLARVGDDDAGSHYIDHLAEYNCDTSLIRRTAGTATGRCVSLITPDAERTMRSHLGASQALSSADAEAVDFSQFNLVHVESYLLYLGDLFETVLRRAREAGCRVSIDLSSFEVARTFRDRLRHLISNQVDILLANEDEAAELLGERGSDEAMATALGNLCPVAALKRGINGSFVLFDAKLTAIEAMTVTHPVDTTVAGDFWGAGFLYGLAEERSPAECGRLGSLLAAEVVKVYGSAVSDERWRYIANHL